MSNRTDPYIVQVKVKAADLFTANRMDPTVDKREVWITKFRGSAMTMVQAQAGVDLLVRMGVALRENCRIEPWPPHMGTPNSYGFPFGEKEVSQ
jgi:hypothetical protein